MSFEQSQNEQYFDQELSQTPERELTPEQVDTIRNMPISPDEKIEVLLIRAGLKPATDIELFSEVWEEAKGEEAKKVDLQKAKAIEEAIGKLGLARKTGELEIEHFSYIEDDSIPVEEIKPEDEIPCEREKLEILAAQNQAILEEFEEATRNQNDEKMGELYDYPETAVKEYLKMERGEEHGLIDTTELPEEIRSQDWFYFINFKPTKGNLEKELEHVRKRADAVKRNSPELYQEYVEYMKKVNNF